MGDFTKVVIPAVSQSCCIFKHGGIPYRTYALRGIRMKKIYTKGLQLSHILTKLLFVEGIK